MKSYFLSFIILLSLSCNRGSKISSNGDFIAVKKQILNQIVSKSLSVKVMETCFTDPNLCGTLAFGSISKVQLLGKHFDNTEIFVATVCAETNYEIDKIYKLNSIKSPTFSIFLCNNLTYNPSSEFNSNNREEFIIFGLLE